jgi:demethylmenaquinone methyltransferase / 2-methoxy-6-polyprenyl-1,4-benzoquinol methylase
VVSEYQSGKLQDKALEIFQGLARTYERALNLATLTQDRYWKAWVVNQTRPRRSDIVLDVGCGTLLLEERLQSSGCTTVGIDLTEPMIRLGKDKRLPNEALLVVGDAEHLPFREARFDAAVSCYVPKYVDLQLLSIELMRVSRPGARIVLYDFIRPSGPLLIPLALYTYGALRIVGWLLGLARRPEATTFVNLPKIIRGTEWNHEIVNVFAKKGIVNRSMRSLSGGVVGGYVGIRSEDYGAGEASP